MTELNINRDQRLPSTGQLPQDKPSSRLKKAVLASFLSLLIVGTGQLYNRQPRKALWLALTIPILLVFAAQTRLVFSFATMVGFFGILNGWRLFFAVEAGYTAWKGRKPVAALVRPRLTYSLVAVAVIFTAFYPSYDDFKRWTSFAAFRVPSASMCPTICLGERFVADMGAYRSKLPERGDIVLLKHKSSPELFIKRVIGVPGDIVAPGPNGTILVNGKPFAVPEICGSPVQQKNNPGAYVMFKSTKVAEGTFFVIGDNLDNSFDSRIPEFGPVAPDQMRGKPLFLYWSSGHSRIGCPIR